MTKIRGVSGGSGSGIKAVDYYADLPLASAKPGKFYYVKNSSGVWPINYKKAGLYYSYGSTWEYVPNAMEASSVLYNNTTSGLTADDVQEAIDELALEKQSNLTGSISGTTSQVNVTANSNSVASNITLSLPQSIATTSAPTFAGITLTNSIYQSGGFAYLGNYNADGKNPRTNADVAIGWNRSAGSREIDFINTDIANSGIHDSFRFEQMLTASTYKTIFKLLGAGSAILYSNNGDYYGMSTPFTINKYYPLYTANRTFDVQFKDWDDGSDTDIYLTRGDGADTASPFLKFEVSGVKFGSAKASATCDSDAKQTVFISDGQSTSINYLESNGSFATKTTTVTTNTTLNATHQEVRCNSSSAFTITLPAANTCINRIYTIKNINTGAITIDGNSSETIDGATTKLIPTQYTSYTIQSNGTSWDII